MSKLNSKFTPGYELEAKDFNEKWHVVKIVETDWSERELLIHFEKSSSKYDEWISMDSSRLRDMQESREELKVGFAVGDRVLATWYDKKKYPATLIALVGKDKYNVLFDDGYTKILRVASLSRLPESYAVGEEENVYVKSNQERRDKKIRSNLSKTPLGELMKSEIYSKTGIHRSRESLSSKEEYVAFIGGLAVQVENGTYKCPTEGCSKTFRKENLLQMHIKHYHPTFVKFLGSTPKVADLAYARTVGDSIEDFIPERKINTSNLNVTSEETVPSPSHSTDNFIKQETDSLDESGNCPLLPETLFSMRFKEEKNYTGIKTLLPVRCSSTPTASDSFEQLESSADKKIQKKKLQNPTNSADKMKKHTRELNLEENSNHNEDSLLNADDSYSNLSYDYNNISIYRPETDNNDSTQSENNITESDESIKIENLSKDEIVNCKCGIYEEHGLMVQCELCLCWQHGECNNIQKEKDVPENYMCYICQHPPKGRDSKQYLHDQEWIYKGKLPTFRSDFTGTFKSNKRTAMLKRSYDLVFALLKIQDLLHSLRVKLNIVQSKDHPKLYLWAKNWSKVQIPIFNNDPVPVMVKIGNSSDDCHEKNIKEKSKFSYNNKNDSDKKVVISDKELMNILEGNKSEAEENCSSDLLLKQDSTSSIISQPLIPEPEALIDPIECKLRLLEHFDHYQDYVGSILNFVETHISALESMELTENQNNIEDKRTKEIIKLLLNDLEIVRKNVNMLSELLCNEYSIVHSFKHVFL